MPGPLYLSPDRENQNSHPFPEFQADQDPQRLPDWSGQDEVHYLREPLLHCLRRDILHPAVREQGQEGDLREVGAEDAQHEQEEVVGERGDRASQKRAGEREGNKAGAGEGAREEKPRKIGGDLQGKYLPAQGKLKTKAPAQGVYGQEGRVEEQVSTVFIQAGRRRLQALQRAGQGERAARSEGGNAEAAHFPEPEGQPARKGREVEPKEVAKRVDDQQEECVDEPEEGGVREKNQAVHRNRLPTGEHHREE